MAAKELQDGPFNFCSILLTLFFAGNARRNVATIKPRSNCERRHRLDPFNIATLVVNLSPVGQDN